MCLLWAVRPLRSPVVVEGLLQLNTLVLELGNHLFRFAAPARYLRDLPAPLAGINLQHGLVSHRGELVKTLETEDGRVELRAVSQESLR